MALRRLSNSSIQTNGKSSKLWDQTTFQSNMFALATVSLTSTASVIEFSGIPSSYTHLQLRAVVRTNRSAANDGDVVYMSFNGDTANNFVSHRVEGNGSSITAYSESASSSIVFNRVTCESAASSNFGFLITDILDYTSTSKGKSVKALCGFDNNTNTTGYTVYGSGLWFASPSAITSIKLAPGGGTAFSVNSHFALYGIKAG